MKLQAPALRDANGQFIGLGDTVSVPPPNETDIYNHAFMGTVVGFHGEYIVVRDGDDDHFDIEPKRLSIEND